MVWNGWECEGMVDNGRNCVGVAINEEWLGMVVNGGNWW